MPPAPYDFAAQWTLLKQDNAPTTVAPETSKLSSIDVIVIYIFEVYLPGRRHVYVHFITRARREMPNHHAMVTSGYIP